MEPVTVKASDGVQFTFTTEETLFEHVNEEAKFWQWLQQLSSTAPATQIWKPLFRPLMAARDLANDATRPVSEKFDVCLENYRKFLTLEPAVHMKSTARVFIQSLLARSNVEALSALATLFQQAGKLQPFDHVTGKTSDSALGMIEAVLFSRFGMAPGLAEFRSLAKQSVEEASQAMAVVKQEQAEATSTRQQMEQLLAIQEAHFTGYQSELEKKSAGLIDQATQALDSSKEQLSTDWKKITETYDNHMALRAPASYWRAKKNSHTRWVMGIGPVTLLTAIGGGWALLEVAAIIFGTKTVLQPPTWYQVLSFSVAAVMYLWTIRSLLRFALSHVHLALDAAERHTMIVSYLALVRKKGLPDGLIDKVFAAIFRPTGDGIVKDEGIPWPSLIDALRSKG